MSSDSNKVLVSIKISDVEGLWNMEISKQVSGDRNRMRTASSNGGDPETNSTSDSAIKRNSLKRNSFYGGSSSPLKSPTKSDDNKISSLLDPIGMTPESIQIAIQHLLIMPTFGITISFVFEDGYGRESEERYNSPQDAVQDLQSRHRSMTPQLKGRLRDLQLQFAQVAADETEIFQEMTMIQILSNKIKGVNEMKEKLAAASKELEQLSVSTKKE